MRFRNDDQRKAMFANMFKGGGKRSKVNGMNVKNFEVNSKQLKMKMPSVKPIRMKGSSVVLKDVKKVKTESESCKMCKKKGENIKDETCQVCLKERKEFEDENRRKIKTIQKKLDNLKTVTEVLQIVDDEQVKDLFDEAEIDEILSEKLDEVISNLTLEEMMKTEDKLLKLKLDPSIKKKFYERLRPLQRQEYDKLKVNGWHKYLGGHIDGEGSMIFYLLKTTDSELDAYKKAWNEIKVDEGNSDSVELYISEVKGRPKYAIYEGRYANNDQETKETEFIYDIFDPTGYVSDAKRIITGYSGVF